MSVTFRHLLSPILRRWCTSSSSSSSSHCVNNSSERYELKTATLKAASHEEYDVNNCDAESNGDCEDVGSKNGAKENDFSDIENVRHMRPESESLMKKRPCGRTKSTSTSTTTATTTTTPKIPLGKQLSSNSKTRSPLTSTPSTSSSVAAKQFSRGNSTQETLSKDEARRRMLSWRKTTKLRKTSGSETAVAAAATTTGNGSKRAKEIRPVKRIASSAAAETSTADDS